jgi:RNA-directed DNA polymerase
MSKSQLLELLFQAYRDCIRTKAQVKRTGFHMRFERELVELCDQLWRRSYRPGISTIFVVTEPKLREVIAASFRDRIVHHLLYNYMSPYWEKIFVDQSYACRKGKGPLQASLDLRTFINRRTRSGRRRLWFAKIDISNFFPSIDQHVLFDIVLGHLHHDFYTWLTEILIFHRPTEKGQYRLNCSRELWRLVPRRKSMFCAAPGKGLPIGNLTSQFFANVYLNEVDQYIAHNLKDRHGVLYWQRYVDDFLCIGEDRVELQKLVVLVDQFLRSRLLITLNPKKTLIQPLCRGIDHLGYFHLPGTTYVRQRVANTAKYRMQKLLDDSALNDGPDDSKQCLATIQSTTNSYLGYFGHADTFRLRKNIVQRLVGQPPVKGTLTSDLDFQKLQYCQPADADKQEPICSVAELACQYFAGFSEGAIESEVPRLPARPHTTQRTQTK